MFSIQLNKVHLYGYHGLYAEEAIVGGTFELAITVNYLPLHDIKAIADTINYVAIYETVKKIFLIPQLLLETLLQDIASAIYLLNKNIKSINISIQKLNPPIHNFTGNVGVQLYKEF